MDAGAVRITATILAAACLVPAPGTAGTPGRKEGGVEPPQIIDLPEPAKRGRVSVEEALARRRSVREFRDERVDRSRLSQLLWSLQGITSEEGDRTAPSAGGLQPLEIYVVLPEGLYRYEPRGHRLQLHVPGDLRRAAWRAALRQDAVLEAPVVFVIAAVVARTSAKYGPQRAPRYVHMEAGHAAQNLLLQAVALGLAGVPVGAFDDRTLASALSLPAGQVPLYLLPVGVPR